MKTLLTAAIITWLLPQQTDAWGRDGHKLIGKICDMHQNLTLVEPISAWADEIKRYNKYQYTKPWHYTDSLDNPPYYCAIEPYEYNNGNNLLDKIEEFYNRSTLLTEFEFKMFVHMYQDLYQPLHTSGKLRGGNNKKVRFFDSRTNLHTVWDTLLVKRRIREFHTRDRYIRHLHTIDIPLDDCHNFRRIADYTNRLNCKLVWINKPESIKYEYYDSIKDTLDYLLVKSGKCLAKLLNGN